MQAQVVQKAKEHVMKVERAISAQKEKKAKEMQAKRAESLNKMAQAETKRTQMLEQVKEKAVVTAQRKPSPALVKDVSV